MVSDIDKRKYLRILIELKDKNVFTQQEIAGYFKVSERSINTFMRGKVYNFWLLTQLAGLLGMSIDFKLIR